MRTVLLSLAALLLVPACGDDGGGDPPIDAPPSSVMGVSCSGATIAAEVTTVGFAFDPAATTVPAGSVVRFTMPATHNAVSDDGLFRADFGTASCFRFTAAGTFGYHCEPHLFTGTITVQ